MIKKINFILVLLLILVSISAVSAADDLNETVSSDEAILDEEVTNEVLTSSNDDEIVASASHTVNSSNYNSYFNYKTGELTSSEVNEGDTIILDGDISGVNFVFKKSINLVGSDSVNLKNCMITFSGSASGCSISNLNIYNTNKETYGIFLNGVSNCVINNCFINNTGASSYAVCIANNANYNNVTNNNLNTYGITYGHGTRSTTPLLISGAHYNYVASNIIGCDDANAIYLSSYSGGPLNGGVSNYNVIYNNTVQYNVLPTSWSYGIQLMGSYNTVNSNNVIGAYRGISSSGTGNIIINNKIKNIRGADYNDPDTPTGGEYAIVASSYSTVINNTIENAKLISSGAGISVLDYSVVENNYVQIVSSTGVAIHPQGSFITIKNNTISTIASTGVFFNSYSFNLTVSNNNITSQSGICVLIKSPSSKKMPGNLTICDNHVWTNNYYAIDAREADASLPYSIVNNIGKGIVATPEGEYNASKKQYIFNGTTIIINSTNYEDYIVENYLSADVSDGDILYFDGEFSNKTIYINKAVKITGKNPKFYNVKFKIYTDGVWIENLTIKNDKVSNGWGVLVYRSFAATIKNCNIDVYDKNAAYAIYVIESTDIDIINNNLTSSGNYLTYTLLALYVEDCNFINNTITTYGTSESYINGGEINIDGNETCTSGSEVCTGGNEVCTDGSETCTSGSEVCTGGNEVCTDGSETCTSGSEVCTSGNTFDGRYVLKEVFRTYGILMAYSSNNIVSGNNVTVTSKLNQTLSRNTSTNSLVGIDLYYNTHNNVISNNNVYIYGKDNFMYGVGVLGYYTGHDAPEGQGATNNQFINNNIIINGSYCVEGIIIGDESENTTIAKNFVTAQSDNVTYGINLEMSQKSIINDNTFILISGMIYGIEVYSSSNNIIINNDFDINANQAYALILSNAVNNNISSNLILVNCTGVVINSTFDSLGNGIAGISLKANSTDNIMEDNNITSINGYAVILEGITSNNIVSNNYLISSEGIGDDAVNNTGENTVEYNYKYLMTGKLEDISIKYLEDGTFIFTTTMDELENATVEFLDFDGFVLGTALINNASATFNCDFADYTPADYLIYAKVYKKNYKVTEFEASLSIDLGDLNITVYNTTGAIARNAEFKALLENILGDGVSGITVEFYVVDDGYPVYIGKAVTGKDGLATLNGEIPQIYGDNPTIIAEVNDPDYFNSVSGEANLTAYWLTKTSITNNVNVYPSGVLAILKDQYGKVLSNKAVSVVIGSKTYNLKTNSKGEITLPAVTRGSYSVSISFAGDDAYYDSKVTGKLTVLASISGNKNSNVYYGNTITYKIRVRGSDGSYGAGVSVTIKVNGKTYSLKTNKKGYVTKKLKLKAGTYTITAEHSGDKVSNKLTFKPTLTAKNIVKKKAKKIKFSVKVVNKKGKAVKKKKVTFKIKGKKYTAKTNKKGVATAKIKNLKAGKYTIASSYGGCTIKNTIKIKK